MSRTTITMFLNQKGLESLISKSLWSLTRQDSKMNTTGVVKKSKRRISTFSFQSYEAFSENNEIEQRIKMCKFQLR